ncbi:pollen-specific leucine-rich repeat extensin-like protein 4 [Iris pallida]|uniref:Pollen-specific leucine-rich repeat extensin-like protein 4 n=1 Tax=Iris pallida TaxID=29817 RepID=A0AAX6DQA0_IRIPA|nr:pollen-specific leucine-rich repeat extensin-like protein 4 [Iris pallida]
MGSVYPHQRVCYHSCPDPRVRVPPILFYHYNSITCPYRHADTDVPTTSTEGEEANEKLSNNSPEAARPVSARLHRVPKIHESSALSPTSGPDRSTVADRGREPPAIRPGQSPPSRRAVSPPSRLLCS